MRSGAFLTACMKEVGAARMRVSGMERSVWEARERHELALEAMAAQLKATQDDLQVG